MKIAAGLLLFFFGGTITAAGDLDLAGVRRAADYSAHHRGVSFLVIQGGRTLWEEYPNGNAARTPHRIYSGTKAFWCLAALAAAQDGLLRLDEPVAKSIPEWRGDPGKAQVSIRQLLDFSAGLAPAFYLQNDNVTNRDAQAIRLPLVAEPGKAFLYGPSTLQVFHRVLQRALGKERPTHYLERRVLRRMGLGPQRYLRDRAGNPLLEAGWLLTARQWSTIGNVALKEGAPVVKSEWFAQTTRGSPANRAFSLGWWNNRAAPAGREFDVEKMLEPNWARQNWRDACLCRAAPRDLIACIGSRYQRLYVIPSLELIVVRQGTGGSFSDGRFLRLLLGR